MKAFTGEFLGFECKERLKSPIIKIIFIARFFDPRVWMDRGLKDKSRNKISAQNPIYIMRYHDFNLEKS